MAWNDVLTGIFGGIAGDPMLPHRIAAARQQMQLQMEKWKMEGESFDLEKKHRLLQIKQAEQAMKDTEQRMLWGQQKNEREQEEQAFLNTPMDIETPGYEQNVPISKMTESDEGPIQETSLTAEGTPEMQKQWVGPQKKTVTPRMLKLLGGKGEEMLIRKWLGPEAITQEAEKGADYQIVEDDKGNIFRVKKAGPEGPVSGVKGKGATQKESKPQYDVIENAAGQQKYLEKGSQIPQGWKISKSPAATVNVNLEKSTKGALEKDIVEKGDALQILRDMETSFKPEYITYPGKARAGAENFFDKFGIVDASKWTEERQQWYQASKENLLKFRKFITGVAGGEKEYDEIASAAPDPDRNGPKQFKANVRQSKLNTIKLIKRWQKILDLTGEKPTKDQLAGIALSSIKVTPEELGEVGEPSIKTADDYLKAKGLQ